MKLLLTGASSFTGMWFATQLAGAGHDVVTTFTQPALETYTGLRRERVEQVASVTDARFGITFGDETFVTLIREWQPEVLCHHAATVGDYRSPDFDIDAAVAANTHNLSTVLTALRDGGCGRVVLTGSVFERREGAGDDLDRSFSPYGESKAITWERFQTACAGAGVSLGKFVIPNPFGPWEEPRFTHYLMKTWAAGDAAGVRTPSYVRDNIHVSLLAALYEPFVTTLPTGGAVKRCAPSQYPETVGRFAERFAAQMRMRLGWACELALAEQTDFSEPVRRVNTEPVDVRRLHWSEPLAWDRIARYYEQRLKQA